MTLRQNTTSYLNKLKKIKDNTELEKKDKDFLIKLAEDSKENIKLCEEIDFSIDDPHCTGCEYFINCILRNIKNNKGFSDK